MKKSLKKLTTALLLLLAVCTVFSCTSCGSSKIPAGAEALEDDAEKYGIPFKKNGRFLVWYDEFEGDALDENKWRLSRTMTSADRVYINDQKHAYFENGAFVMAAFRSEEDKDIFTLSEGLNTGDTMNFKHGYLEMRAKIPMRQGAWPSFWMLSDTVFKTADWMSEVDIIEGFGHKSDIYPNLQAHGGRRYGSYQVQSFGDYFFIGERSYSFNPETINDEFHVYGLEWDEKYFSFSIDDKVYAKIDINKKNGGLWPESIPNADGFHDFHYIIMNNELLTEGGAYLHTPQSRVKADTPFPITYTIDYVRLYQKAGEELKLKADIEAAK